MNDMDKLHIELYSIDGVFQGYASHVSVAKQKVESVSNKQGALSFSTQSAANKICEKIYSITRGGLRCNIN